MTDIESQDIEDLVANYGTRMALFGQAVHSGDEREIVRLHGESGAAEQALIEAIRLLYTAGDAE